MDVSINGGTPKFLVNGWFISWKIRNFSMDNDWGYSHLWKPPNGITPMNEDAGRNGKTTCKVQPDTGHIG